MRRVDEEGSEQMMGRLGKLIRWCTSLPSKASDRDPSSHLYVGAVWGTLGLPDWSTPTALICTYQWSYSLLATTPTLSLGQGNPVTLVRVHAGQVCLG
jgi:hypothetical protein